MTTTTTPPDFTTANRCPNWCNLAPGHPADSADGNEEDPTARLLRGHGGPHFGSFLEGGADEYRDDPGVLAYVVQLHAEAVNITKPSDLLDLATHAIAAAKWLEAHR